MESYVFIGNYNDNFKQDAQTPKCNHNILNDYVIVTMSLTLHCSTITQFILST